jgi:hypothetical protein
LDSSLRAGNSQRDVLPSCANILTIPHRGNRHEKTDTVAR